ncbi:MAG: PTS transporter subunit EIIC [Paeniclostridium sordellii]|uniref:Permease IIC component n=1 Tax=Paeniclostridium hominis TaxID=2764329 RepID=A0ABR7K749_9FIRM|nr:MULTISPECIES: PTS transporter subunit EIIC [Paeniclostridium]MBC6004929.1 PTS sugar transporter subunit IIC [Paeniclostridium hominis]MDU1540545.1 PTS transporter subunit EIIC [Paeniclostridium sordellii]MDU2591843.1 PTS transporter subunit EIIC [Paeniclostridium sordellii]
MGQSKFLEKLDKVLSPIGDKLGRQRHLNAISTGMMMTLPLIVVGSLFLIIANPPINPELVDPNNANVFVKFLLSWKEFAVANYATITAPFDMTMGLLGVMSAFAIAYTLASDYKMNASMSGLISTALFFMICAPSNEGNIPMSFLGADGLFVAIIIGIASVEITRFVDKMEWKFNLPDSVPSAVSSFINTLVPLILNIGILYGLNVIIIANTGMSLPQSIMSILTPALNIADNLWGYLLLITFGNLLWLFGVNGTSIIFPIAFTLGLSNTGLNSDLVAAGQDPNVLMNLQMFRIAILGGAGNTLGLVLLMARSKSAHLKSLGRLSIVPGICGINEPVIFGGPIVFNPILAIPFIVTPIISVSLTYFAQKIGFITCGYIVDPSFTPFFAQAYLSSMDIRNVLFVFILVLISIVTYYPFFKVYEGNMIKKEQEESDLDDDFSFDDFDLA